MTEIDRHPYMPDWSVYVNTPIAERGKLTEIPCIKKCGRKSHEHIQGWIFPVSDES